MSQFAHCPSPLPQLCVSVGLHKDPIPSMEELVALSKEVIMPQAAKVDALVAVNWYRVALFLSPLVHS